MGRNCLYCSSCSVSFDGLMFRFAVTTGRACYSSVQGLFSSAYRSIGWTVSWGIVLVATEVVGFKSVVSRGSGWFGGGGGSQVHDLAV